MALTINFISNRVVKRDASFLITLDQGVVHHFNRVTQHMVSKKAKTNCVDITKLPKKTQPNTSSFKKWFTNTEEELYQKTSSDRIYPIGFVICGSKAPIDY